MIRAGASQSSDKRHPDLDRVLSLIRTTERPAGDFLVEVIEIHLVY